jgi:hypothetical protein
MTCGTCRWFASRLSERAAMSWGEGMGECRRYAPRGPVMVQANAKGQVIQIASAFAPVPEDDWCGEWQAPRTAESSTPPPRRPDRIG